MTSDAEQFRHAAGRFATGVTVVTARVGADVYGVTVSSFASLSLNPLLVTVSIRRGSALLSMVHAAGHFGVSVLSSGQREVGAHFASAGRAAERDAFAAAPSSARATGAPIIDGCVSWFDCVLDGVLPGGDHEILVGQVAAAGGGPGVPLVYWAGAYRSLAEVGATPGDGPGAAVPTSSTAHGAPSEPVASQPGGSAPGGSAPGEPEPGVPGSAGLAAAADAVSVSLHLLGVGPAEMLDAQLAIEPAIAALAASVGTSDDWDRLDAVVAASDAAAGEPDAFNQLALDTHDLIARTGGNRALAAALLSLRHLQSRHYRERGSRQTADAAVAEHRAIAAALRAGDPDRSAALMRDHLDQVRERLVP